MLISGSMVALATPFKKGKIDFKAIKRLINFHLKNGTDGLVPCGTTGEAATMSLSEHKQVLKFVVKETARRIPVICGCGSNNTEEAKELVVYSEKIGADAVLVVTPYYNKPTQEGLYRHYKVLSGAVKIPLVLYNVPSRTGCNLLPSTVARLAKIKNIVAIKEASGCLEQAAQILQKCDITLLSGDDGLTLPLLSIGAQGVISVAANVVPDKIASLVHSYLRGDIEEAKELHYELLDINRDLFIETNPIPVKTAMGLMGLIKNVEFRLPLCEMSRDNKMILKKTLQGLKLIKR